MASPDYTVPSPEQFDAALMAALMADAADPQPLTCFPFKTQEQPTHDEEASNQENPAPSEGG